MAVEDKTQVIEDDATALQASAGVATEDEVDASGEDLGNGRRQQQRTHVSLEDKAEAGQEISARILDLLGVKADEVSALVKDDQVIVQVGEIELPEGKRLEGRTWESLQFILNKAVNRSALKRTRVQVDADGLRSRRGGGLDKVAQAVARKVQQTGKAISIGPLAPQDLRLFSVQFGRTNGVSVRTVGDEEYKKLLIAPSTAGGRRRRRR